MRTPFSRKYAKLVSLFTYHSGACATEFWWTRFVVVGGKRSARSYRSWWPKIDVVPVTVRSDFFVPWSRTWRNRSSYWVFIAAMGTIVRVVHSRRRRRSGSAGHRGRTLLPG